MNKWHTQIVNDESQLALSSSTASRTPPADNGGTPPDCGENAIEMSDEPLIDLLMPDLDPPSEREVNLIRRARSSMPKMRTPLITVRDRVDAQRLETGNYLSESFYIPDLTQAIRKALAPSSTTGQTHDEIKRLRDWLISTISYELRAPLTYILNYASVLADPAAAHSPEMAQSIVQHVLHIRDTLDELTVMAEWAVERALDYPQPVDLRQVLTDTLAQLSSLALERNQNMHTVAPPDPVWIVANTWMLSLLFVSLISEAMKYTQEQTQIGVNINTENNKAIVIVKGPGRFIPVEKFVPNELSSSLTIACGLAEALDGQLQAMRTASGDVAFRLSLPTYY